MIVRDDIPLGYTYDANGRELTRKNSNGHWLEYTYDANGRELTYKNSYGFWCEYTRDANGRELTFKNSSGYWREYTRDAEGRVLTCKDSHGYWVEYTRDDKGRVLTHKQEGFSGTRIADDGEYVLFRDAEKDLFLAGCRGPLTRAEALEHWDRVDERAELFTKAIQLLGG